MRLSSLLLKLIKFGIGFILVIPLFIGGAFYFPFIFPKIWLFQLITEIILFLYIVLALIDARFRPKWNWVVGAVALLTIVLIITSFTGVDAFRSFWGNTERMSGVIAWFHFAVFAIIASIVVKTEKEWKKFFGIAVAVSALEFFYALAQYVDASWVWLPSSRAGTIGNADLLGSYAIFGAFFALYLWRNSANFRWIWATAFFMNIGTLFIASSRGAIIGFIGGMIVFAFFSIINKKNAFKTAAITTAIVLAIYGAFWFAKGADFVKNNVQIDRLINVSLQSDTVRQRFTEWGIAWDAFLARPLLGWGPNNYLYLHNAFLNPKVYELRETNFDRAHNAYLDYASMSGILGLASYAVLIAVLFFVFSKNRLWTMASLVAAYAVQSFFVFDSPASYIALFLVIGFAMFVGNARNEPADADKEGSAKHFKPQTAVALSLVACVVLLFIFWQVSVRQASANMAFTRAFTGLNAGSVTPEDAFENYQKALKYETLGATEFRNQYTQWIQGAIEKFPPEKRLSLIEFGIGELEKEAANHPLVFAYLNLGQLYYFEANGISNENLKPELYAKAAQSFDSAIELAPKRLEVYYSYLQLYLTTKEYGRGVEIIKKTTEFAPNYPKNWWYLGIANIAAGREEDGIAAINKALTMYYAPNVAQSENGLNLEFNVNQILKDRSSAMPSTQEILGVVSPYIERGKYKELLLLYLGAEMNDPKNVDIHKSLALVYQNLGLVEKVDEEINIIDKLSQ